MAGRRWVAVSPKYAVSVDERTEYFDVQSASQDSTRASFRTWNPGN